jgi:uncharacterized RDD family membrane protein YckC
MTWYFVNAGQQAGPITDVQLEEYVRAGRILPDTLIWREGMENWQPCREVKSALLLNAPTTPAFQMAAGTPLLASTTPGFEPLADGIVCSECGGLHSKQNAIRNGESWICAGCKPVFVQKLKEGVVNRGRAGALEYAGIGARFVAKLLDGLIIGVPGILLMGAIIGVLAPLLAKNKGAEETIVLVIVGGVLFVMFAMVLFQIWCLPKWGGTPGKRIMGLRVVTAEGGSISWGRSFGRFFGEWINGLIPFGIGYIIELFDDQRRTVHDHIAGTRVIRV